jgi:hypothetical protein
MIDEAPAIFYFGCIGQPGHYLWRTEQFKVYQSRQVGIPEDLHHALDGAFCPDGIKTYPQQRWQCSIVPPWTIVAWWDRSVDSRPNCCSAFIGRDFGNEPHRLLEAAKVAFPSVFARQPQPLEEFHA